MFIKYNQKRRLLEKIYDDFTKYQEKGDWVRASNCAKRYIKIDKKYIINLK